MSIIQEALKKVQEIKSPRAGVMDKWPDRPGRPSDKVRFPPPTSNPTKPGKKLFSPMNLKLALPIFLIILAVPFFIFAQTRIYGSAAKNSRNSSQEVSYKTIIKPADTKTENYGVSQIKHFASAIKLSPGYPDLVLNGIMYLEDGPRAIINNSIVGEGDTISGAVVHKINRRDVILRSDDTEIKIDLK